MNEDQLIAALAANPALIDGLVARLKASGTTNQVISPTGPNALFNTFGLNPNIPSTIVRPQGLEAFLYDNGHVFMSQYEQELFGIMTGQTASSGAESTSGCSESAPTPGDLKLCRQVWPFGEMTMLSRPIQVDRAGALLNRSEPLDLRLVNNPFAEIPNLVPTGNDNLFRDRLTKAVVELTFDFRRRYARLTWTGNPTNTAANTGGYQEYNGLARIVNTGYRDVGTGQLCSAADSLVRNAAFAVIQDTAITTVRRYTEIYRALRKLAEDIDSSVQWAFVMRYQKFLSLTEIWPCAYATYRCTTAAPSGNAVVIDGTGIENNRMREAMRNGRYLLLDGEQVPVIIDNTLDELNVGGGRFQSDTYLLPLTMSGLDNGGRATYIEHFNYRGPFGMETIISQMGPQDEYRVSPDGRFAIFFLGGTAFCKQVMIRTRKRIICRAPFLAARIDAERYNVYEHEREWQPGTSFFEDGGATSFAGPSWQSPV